MRTQKPPAVRILSMVLVAVAVAGIACAALFTGLGRDARDAVVGATDPSGPLPTTDGTGVLIIGDSVTVAARPSLERTFAGAEIDAAVNQQLVSLDEHLRQAKAEGPLPPVVVVALGTNGGGPRSVLDAALRELGPERKLVLVTPHGDRAWMPEVRDTYARFAAGHPHQVFIADWDSASSRVEDFADDGIHPGPQGGRIFARVVADAVATARGGAAS